MSGWFVKNPITQDEAERAIELSRMARMAEMDEAMEAERPGWMTAWLITPGQWRVDGGEIVGEYDHIAEVSCVGDATEGNAHLIAAAPDLYENAVAARDTMERAAMVFETLNMGDEAQRLRNGVAACLDVIRRARGEQ